MKSKIRNNWPFALVFLLIGLLLGWLLFGSSGHDSHDSHDHSTEEAAADEVWTCSMHPSIRDDGPGTCPICAMDLIPASAAEADDDAFSMTMTESAMRLAEIQVVEAKFERPEINVRAPGVITTDERTQNTISAHFSGRITELNVNYTGARVREGQPMATVYSDDLIIAQRELLESYRRRNANPGLYESARQKLLFWDIREEQIDMIIEKGEPVRQLEILAPASGVVTELGVSRGDYFRSGTTLFTISDLSRVWINFDLFEDESHFVKTGQTIHFSTRTNPGAKHEATITWVDPLLDTSRRTVRARAEARNRSGELRPGMLLNGELFVETDEAKVLIPSSAVLWTGPRSMVYVYEKRDDSHRFEAREVTLGNRAGDYYVIEEGLEEGEQVVFHGAFKIDSEMQLSDRFSMMNRDKGRLPEDPHNREVQDVSDEVSEDFRAEFTAFIEMYLEVKDALVESDFDEASAKTGQMKEQLEAIGEHRNDGDAHVLWMEMYGNIAGHLRPVANAGDIETLRSEFRFLSDMLVDAVKAFGIEGVVYQQYCPMAFDDEGAFWLSTEEQIKNPYLPETMLMCGEVIERIE